MHPLTTEQRDAFFRLESSVLLLVQYVAAKDAASMARFRKSSAAAAEAAGGARSHDVHIDQYLAGGEMPFEVITIDRFIHPKAALAAFDACEPLRHQTLSHSCTLAVQPNEQLSGIVKRLSFLAPIFRWWLGTNKEAPMTRFPEIANPQTGPIPETVARMREHDQAAPFYMMNLNKYYAQARYPEGTKDNVRQTSGEKAYGRYSNRILPYLVSVGGYPDVFGKVVWMLAGEKSAALDDDWHEFAMVFYPSRKNFLRMMSNSPRKGVQHRAAGLQRAVLMPCTNLKK